MREQAERLVRAGNWQGILALSADVARLSAGAPADWLLAMDAMGHWAAMMRGLVEHTGG